MKSNFRSNSIMRLLRLIATSNSEFEIDNFGFKKFNSIYNNAIEIYLNACRFKASRPSEFFTLNAKCLSYQLKKKYEI